MLMKIQPPTQGMESQLTAAKCFVHSHLSEVAAKFILSTDSGIRRSKPLRTINKLNEEFTDGFQSETDPDWQPVIALVARIFGTDIFKFINMLQAANTLQIPLLLWWPELTNETKFASICGASLLGIFATIAALIESHDDVTLNVTFDEQFHPVPLSGKVKVFKLSINDVSDVQTLTELETQLAEDLRRASSSSSGKMGLSTLSNKRKRKKKNSDSDSSSSSSDDSDSTSSDDDDKSHAKSRRKRDSFDQLSQVCLQLTSQMAGIQQQLKSSNQAVPSSSST